jgi:hypothetical protein
MTELQRLKKENEDLRKELELYKTDGMQGLYHALNYQLSSLAKELSVEYVSFTSKNDKTFERVWKAMVDSKEVAQNLMWLKKELKIGEDENQEKASTKRNPIEMFRQMKT